MIAGALMAAVPAAALAWLVWPWWQRLVDFGVGESDLPASLTLTVRLSGYAGLWQLVVVAAVLGGVLAKRWKKVPGTCI